MTVRTTTKVTLSPLLHQREAGSGGFLLQGTVAQSRSVGKFMVVRLVQGYAGKSIPKSGLVEATRVRHRPAIIRHLHSHKTCLGSSCEVSPEQSKEPTQISTLLQGSPSSDPHLGLNDAPGPKGRGEPQLRTVRAIRTC